MSERLTLSEAASELDVPRQALVRLIGEPTGYIARSLDAQGKPPTIPASKIPGLRVWAERRDSDPRFRPATLAQAISDGADLDLLLTGQVESAEGEITLTGQRSTVNGELSRAITPAAEAAFERIVGRVVAEVVAATVPAQKDRLILSDEVRAILSGPIPKILKPVAKSPARWKESDVMKWIKSL